MVDDRPIVTVNPSTLGVDESALASGPIVATGSVTVDYGNDGPGMLAGTGMFSIGGSLPGGQLTSGGTPVSITHDAPSNTFTGMAGSDTVFTFVFDVSTGQFTYMQTAPLDHADSADPNDEIFLSFVNFAIDADGDREFANMRITVADDAPVTAHDTITFSGTAAEAIDLLANDVALDGAIITNVSIGVTDYPIAATGNTVINLPEGTLVLAADGTGSFTSNTGSGSVSLTYTVEDGDGDEATGTADIDCFHAGTLIATPSGACPVEELQIGDAILTEDGRRVPVRWIGRQTVTKRFHRERAEPVRITSGALGEGVPNRDLTVTGDHGIILDGLIINASALVNGTTIYWVPLSELPERFTVYHVETAAHEVILANGTPAETYLDASDRSKFDNYQEYLDLYFSEKVVKEMSMPRISSRRLLPDRIVAALLVGVDRSA